MSEPEVMILGILGNALLVFPLSPELEGWQPGTGARVEQRRGASKPGPFLAIRETAHQQARSLGYVPQRWWPEPMTGNTARVVSSAWVPP